MAQSYRSNPPTGTPRPVRRKATTVPAPPSPGGQGGERSYQSRPAGFVKPHFILDGVRYEARISILEVFAWAETVSELDPEKAEGFSALMDIFKDILVDYAAFAAHVKEECTDPAIMFDILKDMVDDLYGGNFAKNPTQRRPSKSANGPSSNGRTPMGDSSPVDLQTLGRLLGDMVEQLPMEARGPTLRVLKRVMDSADANSQES